MGWTISENRFGKKRGVARGNKFLLANGYMGYRGTVDGDEKSDLVALSLAGLYDGVAGKWRETVNAPDPLYMRVYCFGEPLLASAADTFCESLDMRCARLSIRAYFKKYGVNIESERVVHFEKMRELGSRVVIRADKAVKLRVEAGINGDVWDLNGPHLKDMRFLSSGDMICCESSTQELGVPLRTSLCVSRKPDAIAIEEKRAMFVYDVELGAGEEFTLDRIAYVGFGEHASPSSDTAAADIAEGYDAFLRSHRACWEQLWDVHDVRLVGDSRAQLALRYSIYHLLILTPRSAGQSIAARGLSGQTYKGAVFWDTEIFLLPFFAVNDLSVARRLIEYRIRCLDGARQKAASYGYDGAFYAWESQDGYDACSDFNVTDVFTHRPVRTYFKDKQIHISGDVAYALINYVSRSGDMSVLYDGGLEMLIECARFFYSYSRFDHTKCRYELLDVIGPDEYHERVNNNAFTNMMAKFTAEAAVEQLEKVRALNPRLAAEMDRKFGSDLSRKLSDWADKLYLYDEKDGVIEQFDGYFALEDVKVDEVRARLVKKNEYWGGSGGVATATRVIKQADVIAMLVLFGSRFGKEIVEKNFMFYLPYTEHGSSLSASMYAMSAIKMSRPDDAWQWFIKTATVDLSGKSKQWAGEVYIGGTHPAAAGGAYMTAVYGFAGLSFDDGRAVFAPKLPKNIKAMYLTVTQNGECKKVKISPEGAKFL